MNCENCKRYKRSCTGGISEVACQRIQMPVTNGDRIRAMSDYDLADWIAQILNYHGSYVQDVYRKDGPWECDSECPLYKCCNDQPTDNIEEWLGLPAEDDR